MERCETPAEDDAIGCYEEGTITSVSPPSSPDGSWSIGYGDCWGEGVPAGDWSPKVGDHLRVYGRFGRAFHGQALNGRVLWYSTSAEMEAKHLAMVAKMESDSRDRFEAARPQLDRDYDSLPPVLRLRIDRFRASNPDFRWCYEGYEMFVCTQAAALHAWASQQAAPLGSIEAWSDLGHAEQMAVVASWSDGHSGNTWGCAIALAKSMVQHREQAAVLPGALTPLVGTTDYSVRDT